MDSDRMDMDYEMEDDGMEKESRSIKGIKHA